MCAAGGLLLSASPSPVTWSWGQALLQAGAIGVAPAWEAPWHPPPAAPWHRYRGVAAAAARQPPGNAGQQVPLLHSLLLLPPLKKLMLSAPRQPQAQGHLACHSPVWHQTTWTVQAATHGRLHPHPAERADAASGAHCDQQNTSGLRTTDPASERRPSFQLALRAGGCISGPRKMPI